MKINNNIVMQQRGCSNGRARISSCNLLIYNILPPPHKCNTNIKHNIYCAIVQHPKRAAR